MNTNAEPTSPLSFDFGLTQAQEERARRLHDESLVVDMLFQHPGGARIFEHIPESDLRATLRGKRSWSRYAAAQSLPYDLAIAGKSEVVRGWWEQSGIDLAAVGIAVADGRKSDDRIYRWLEGLPWMHMALTVADIRRAKQEGTRAVYGNCQPTYGLPLDLKEIERAYSRGLRCLMLTYNRMDHVGVGCTERVDAGLSNFGLNVVRLCNDIGILVDTSHCGRATTLDACRHSSKPVMANHTSAAAVFQHVRGKSDDVLKAIADTGGVIGVCAVPFFLASQAAPTIEVWLDHVDHIVKTVGWQYVGIGTDWPLQAPHSVLNQTLGPLLSEIGFREEHRVSVAATLVGFSDYREFPNFTRGLVKRGYTDEQIRGILGENFLRVFGAVCG